MRLVVARHDGADEVEVAYRAERDGVRRGHLQVIWLLLGGMGLGEVSRATGFSVRWIEKLIHRWNDEGLAGLGDRRHGNPGKKPFLDEADQAELAALLEGPAPDGGLWSGRQVAAWMSERLGRAVDAKLGLDYLHRLGFSRQQPRPCHAKAADAETQAAFKKNSARRWRRRGQRTPTGPSSCGPSTSTGSA
jgi:transposase